MTILKCTASNNMAGRLRAYSLTNMLTYGAMSKFYETKIASFTVYGLCFFFVFLHY